MNKIDQSIINTLLIDQECSVLSIYAPVHQISTPATQKEDHVRLKNLIDQGIEQLCHVESDVNAKTLQAKIGQAIEKNGLWAETSKSVAIFTNGRDVQLIHLPIECSEYVSVSVRYDVTPLQLALDMNQPFYVFALAMHNAKLFRGDLYGLQPLNINFPSSPEDALNIDEMFNGSNTIRGLATGGGGNDMFSTHGQGDSNHAGQEERLMYFRILDHMIMASKEFDSSAPVVIAATQSEAADFRSLSKIPRLLETYIAGNHTNTQLHELHAQAWRAISRDVLGQKTSAAIAQFNELKGIQRGSSDPEEILQAAKAGRVDTLLVGLLETTNDSVEDGAHTKEWIIRLNNDYRSRIASLVNAIKAQGGKIIGVDTTVLATPTHVAAVYRY